MSVPVQALSTEGSNGRRGARLEIDSHCGSIDEPLGSIDRTNSWREEHGHKKDHEKRYCKRCERMLPEVSTTIAAIQQRNPDRDRVVNAERQQAAAELVDDTAYGGSRRAVLETTISERGPVGRQEDHDQETEIDEYPLNTVEFLSGEPRVIG